MSPGSRVKSPEMIVVKYNNMWAIMQGFKYEFSKISKEINSSDCNQTEDK